MASGIPHRFAAVGSSHPAAQHRAGAAGRHPGVPMRPRPARTEESVPGKTT
jgi:hypothetical protein